MKRLSKGIYPGLACASIIMVLLGLPGKYFPAVVSFWEWLSPDKIIHFILFGLLNYISLWGYRSFFLDNEYVHKNKLLVIISLICILYGGITELLQKYIFINRYGSIYDFIADTIGVFLGMIFFHFFIQKKLKKLKKSEDNI